MKWNARSFFRLKKVVKANQAKQAAQYLQQLADEAEEKAKKEGKIVSKPAQASDFFAFEPLPTPAVLATTDSSDKQPDDIFDFFQPSKNDEDLVI